MIKLSHSVFALPFAIVAAFLAGRNLEAGRPRWGQLLLVVLCMVAARSVAMTFNRLADAGLDALNPRTRDRALPAGRIRPGQAWAFLIVCGAGFIASCSGFLVLYGNPWPLALAAPVLACLCAYSYTKRFTKWSHFFLGAAIGLSPLAAWLAVDPASLGLPAVLLSITVMLWIGGFDIIYACQDIEVDRRCGLHSLPARLGPRAALAIARLAHGLTVALLAWIGLSAALGSLYWIGFALVAGLLLVENLLVRPGDYSRINVAFFTVNGLVSVALAVLAVADILLLS
jgi:4-hydroxybenzoate polyprenyltransferase